MEDNEIWMDLGSDLIKQSDFLNNAANNIEGYVNSKPWSKKKKESFLNAYKSLIDSGVVGATNQSGRWELIISGEEDPNSLSSRDKKMLEPAARYIFELMKASPSRKLQEETQAPKIKYNGGTTFEEWIKNNVFGGLPFNMVSEWNTLDPDRDNKGRRSVKYRIGAIKKYLEKYKEDLKNYDFENSPLGDLVAVLSKVDKAIESLEGKTELDLDIINSLNALGIKPAQWFDDGRQEDTEHINTQTGRPYTYGEWNQILENKKLKELETQKLYNEALLQNPWSKVSLLTFGKNMRGWSPTDFANKFGSNEGVISALNELSTRMSTLTPEELSMLYGAVKHAPKEAISLEEFDVLKRFDRYKGSSISRFSKISGVEGLILDNSTGQLIYPKSLGNSGNTNWLLGKSSAELDLLKRIDAGNRKPSEGFETEDISRMVAAAADITSIVASFVPGYGTAVAAGGGLTSLGANLVADWADDSVTAGQLLKNIGINTALGVIGLVPGLGAATKTGRILGTIARWIPRIVALGAAGLVALSPEVHASLKKVTDDPKNLTVNDWKNIGYALSATAGVARGARGIADYRKYNPAFKNSTPKTVKKYDIKTSKGKTITVTEEEARKLSSKNITEEEVRKILKLKKDETVNLKDRNWLDKQLKKAGVEMTERTETVTEQPSPRLLAYLRALRMLNERRKAAHPTLSRYIPTSYDIYKSAATATLPSVKPFERIKKLWDPVGESKAKSATTPEVSTPAATPAATSAAAARTPSRKYSLTKAEAKELKSTFLGKNFSTNTVKPDIATSVKGYGDFYGMKNPDGTYNVEIQVKGVKDAFKISNVKEENLKGEVLKLVRQTTKKLDAEKILPKNQKSRIKFEIIKELKKNGYLRKGGIINSPLDTKISEFLNKLKWQ